MGREHEDPGPLLVSRGGTAIGSLNFVCVSLLTAVVAFCSIVYELVYSQALTVLYGETVSRYSVTIGLYLLSLGAGAFFYTAAARRTSSRFFWWNELALSLIGPLGVVALFELSASTLPFGPSARAAALTLSHVPVVLVGVLSGFELPLLVGLLDPGEKDKFSKILGLDYVGSFIGTVVYALWLYPRAGLITTAFAVGAFNVLALAVYSFWKLGRDWAARLAALVFLLIFAILLFFSDDIQGGVQQRYRGAEVTKIFGAHARSAGGAVRSVEIQEHFSTSYQDVTLYRVNYSDGSHNECLSLDSNVQLCDSWIDAYHAGLVDMPLSQLGGRPLDVLVLGGGDWIAIRRLLERADVRSIDHVDIDEEFFTFMKDHPRYRDLQRRAWEDPRVHTVTDDAFNYLRFNRKHYDLVLFDLPGITHDKLAHLYSVEFFGFLARALKDGGLFVMWDYGAADFRKHYMTLMDTLLEAGFSHHLVYNSQDVAPGRFRSTQPFYLVAKSPLGGDEDRWLRIPRFKGVRPNTVLKPNYDMVIH